jgi:dihydropteroate synthase type 2
MLRPDAARDVAEIGRPSKPESAAPRKSVVKARQLVGDPLPKSRGSVDHDSSVPYPGTERRNPPVRNRVQSVGIVNLTADSFSDGGRYLDPARAIAHARTLREAGADRIELGPASSHPDAAAVSADEQIARLRPVVAALHAEAVPLCVDATDPRVLQFALEQGVEWLNDVRGFADAALHPTLAAGRATLVVVHSLLQAERAGRELATPRQVLDSIERFFDERLAALVRAGVAEDRLIVDPGMGFFLGRDPRASIAVLQRLSALRSRFGRPLLVSVSRKSFLRVISGSDLAGVGAATLAAELHAARAGADYIRTHDVRALRDGLAIEQALSIDAID